MSETLKLKEALERKEAKIAELKSDLEQSILNYTAYKQEVRKLRTELVSEIDEIERLKRVISKARTGLDHVIHGEVGTGFTLENIYDDLSAALAGQEGKSDA